MCLPNIAKQFVQKSSHTFHRCFLILGHRIVEEVPSPDSLLREIRKDCTPLLRRPASCNERPVALESKLDLPNTQIKCEVQTNKY